MSLNPLNLKVLLASALAVSGSGILALKVIGREDLKDLSTSIQAVSDRYEKSDADVNHTESNPLEGCSIYLVERSSNKGAGYLNGIIRDMYSVSKILGKFKDLNSLLKTQESNNARFVTDVKNSGCKNLGGSKKMYVYKGDNGSLVYSSELQRKDGSTEVTSNESLIESP